MKLSQIFNKATAGPAFWTGLSAVFTFANLPSAMNGSLLGIGLAALCGYCTYSNAKAWHQRMG